MGAFSINFAETNRINFLLTRVLGALHENFDYRCFFFVEDVRYGALCDGVDRSVMNCRLSQSRETEWFYMHNR